MNRCANEIWDRHGEVGIYPNEKTERKNGDTPLWPCSDDAESGEVRIFKTENGRRVAQIHAKQGPVFTLAFTSDGKQFATGGYDGRIRFYDAEKGDLLKDIEGVPFKASDDAKTTNDNPIRK